MITTMERYIFVIREDVFSDGDSSHLIFPWIKNMLPKGDIGYENEEVPLFRLVPAAQDFLEVWSQPDATMGNWVNQETLERYLTENTILNAEDDNVVKQDVDTYFHQTIDTIPCTGCIVHMYIFLSAGDLGTEDSYVLLGSGIIRLLKWHFAKVSVVLLDANLTYYGMKLAMLTQGEPLSITKQAHSEPVSWTGEISMRDYVDDVVCIMSAFSIYCPNWETILKETIALPHQHSLQFEGLDLSGGKPMCGHTFEMLEFVPLATFPLCLTSQWSFQLHTYHNMFSAGVGTVLINSINEDARLGMMARLQVYYTNEEVPICGDSMHRSTWAWREFIQGQTSEPPPESPTSLTPEKIFKDSDFIPSPFEYLHVLFLPDSGSLGKSLTVRVLLTARQIAKYILRVLRTGIPPVDVEDSQLSKKDKERVKREMARRMKTIPVFRVRPFCDLIQRLGQDDAEMCIDLDGYDEFRFAAGVEHDSLVADIYNLFDFEDEDRTDQDWMRMSEGMNGLSKCPEWKALVAKHRKLNDLPLEDSCMASTSSSSSSIAGPSRKRFSHKSKSDDFSIDHVLNIFKGDRAGREGFQTPKKQGEGKNTRLRELSDSSIDGMDGDRNERQLDVYHYNSESDYDFEVKYAEIRDRGSFQDTQSSFVTPQKKASRQFQPQLATRSSPRAKLPSRRSSLSQINSPKQQTSQSTPTFKHPKLTGQRKRPSSSLTPDSESICPVKISRSNSSPNVLSSSSALERVSGLSIPSTSSTSQQNYKRVPFTTVPELEASEPLVRRSPRKLPSSSQSVFGESSKHSKQRDSSLSSSMSQSSFEASRQGKQSKSASSDPSGKMKRSERHMMRLKNIIAGVLKEKGIKTGDLIYDACSKNLLNVSIILLKTLPNSKNLSDEMKSVVEEQVQQIINLEKRRSGIAL